VLTGTVSSPVAASQAVDIADAYVRYINRDLVIPIVAGGGEVGAGTRISVGGGTSISQARSVAGVSIINMLKITDPMQVLLEVKVAEVSKGLLDQLGASFNATNTSGDYSADLLTSLLATATSGTIGGLLTLNGPNGGKIEINAEKGDTIARLLAEPNIMAISGQEGSFLSGGTVFVTGDVNATTGIATLVEKEFGVRLRFLPTVLANGRINLKVEPEVSEPSDAFESAERISFTTRKASTTVQLNDGQSFAIAGLIKSNISESVRRIPVLGEIPILGALFRSSDFQEGKTELMFVVTPHLVKPLPPNYRLPGDNFKAPGRVEFFLEGRMESATPPAAPAATPAKANPDSLRMN
jgi:pilus assembly protein CpaC